jgi:hypothetical protein
VLFDLHGFTLACESPDSAVAERWTESFASRPQARNAPDTTITLRLVPRVPDAPESTPSFSQGDLLSVYQNDSQLHTLHFPRFGQMRVDLRARRTDGEIVGAALSTYGVLEDLIAMGLTAHLRRHGLFLIHAFAAAYAGCAVLLVGAIGSGKTTTGISLLRAGWKLLSNDSPMLSTRGRIITLAYPGLLSADADTLQRFPELARFSPAPVAAREESKASSHRKVTFAAESVYPDVWIESAPVGAIVFPRVAHRVDHSLNRLNEAEALRRLLPNAIDRWDADMIPVHLKLLRSLVAGAAAYTLDLGENANSLSGLLAPLLECHVEREP